MKAPFNVITPEVGTGAETKLPVTDQSEFITAQELIRRIPMGRGALRARMKDGTIPYVQLGGRKYHFHWPTVTSAILRLQRGGQV
jgi:hypothetical protein